VPGIEATLYATAAQSVNEKRVSDVPKVPVLTAFVSDHTMRPVMVVRRPARDADAEVSASLGRSRPRCPTCRAPVDWAGNPHRPFCSFSCRLIDLGGWRDERYQIAGDRLEEVATPPDPPNER